MEVLELPAAQAAVTDLLLGYGHEHQVIGVTQEERRGGVYAGPSSRS